MPPNGLDLAARTLETTVLVPRGARTVRIAESNGQARVEIVAGRNSETVTRSLARTVRHMLRLDEDVVAQVPSGVAGGRVDLGGRLVARQRNGRQAEGHGAVPWARSGKIPRTVAIPRAVCFVLIVAEPRAD